MEASQLPLASVVSLLASVRASKFHRLQVILDVCVDLEHDIMNMVGWFQIRSCATKSKALKLRPFADPKKKRAIEPIVLSLSERHCKSGACGPGKGFLSIDVNVEK